MKTLSGLLPVTLILLSACGDSAEAPTGQVVATVAGKEITAAELNAELAALPQQIAGQAQVQPFIVQSLVNRNILAEEAIKQGIDQLPATAVQQEKARQMVLVNALQKKIADSVPAPSAEEAKQYIEAHPASFAQRRIFVVDQLIVPTRDPALLKALEPLDTMDQVVTLLQGKKIPMRRTVGTLDAIQIDPKAAESIAALPTNAIFVAPEANMTRINRIRDVMIEPVVGDDAVKLANERIKARRTQELVANKIQEIITAGQASVKYNAQYDPKTAATGGAKPAATPSPAAPQP